MKSSFFKTVMAALLCCIALPSCLNTKDEQFTITQTYSNYVNSIVDYSSGERYEYAGVGYTIVYNYGNYTANVSITNLRLPDGTVYPTLSFEKVPYILNKAGWREIVLTDAKPVGEAGFSGGPTFTSLVIQVIDRVAGQYSIPSLTSIKYIIGDYEIFSLPTTLVFGGETEVTPDKGEVYKPGKDNPITYGVSLDPTRHMAMITIASAKFAAAMPAQNMRFKDIPYEITAYGDIVFDRGESFVPYLLSGTSSSTATETPFPAFPISALSAKYVPIRGFYLDFTCTQMKDGEAMAAYKVHMVDDFPSESTTQQ